MAYSSIVNAAATSATATAPLPPPPPTTTATTTTDTATTTTAAATTTSTATTTTTDTATATAVITTSTSISRTANNQNNSTEIPPPPPVARTGSAGSITPSSWFSPETPTAVVFQQKDKDDTHAYEKRKSSVSIEPATTKKRLSILSPTSPGIRATGRLKLEQPVED